MQDEVLNFGFSSSTTFRGRVQNWLNEAQQKIARRTYLDEVYTSSTQSTVAASSSITKPTDLVRIDAVYDTTDANNQRRLRPIEARELAALNAASGAPSVYCIDG